MQENEGIDKTEGLRGINKTVRREKGNKGFKEDERNTLLGTWKYKRQTSRSGTDEKQENEGDDRT